MAFATTSTHRSRYPYRAPAVRLAATFPGSTYAMAATNAGPSRSGLRRRRAAPERTASSVAVPVIAHLRKFGYPNSC